MLERIRRALAAAIAAALDEMGQPAAQVVIEVPPRRQLGDLAWAGALPLAKALRRPPRAIAEEVASRLSTRVAAAQGDDPLAVVLPEVAIEGPGFVNVRLRRGAMLARLLRDAATPPSRTPDPGPRSPVSKVIVEHTNINPNKAAHIGHLRNAVLGDTLVRCLRFLGHRVEVQDYIDDTGVQVADVVVGFLYLPENELQDAVAATGPLTGWEPFLAAKTTRSEILRVIGRRAAGGQIVNYNFPSIDFDDLCWELYPRVTRWYDADDTATAFRTEVLHAIEHGFPAAMTLEYAIEGLLPLSPQPSPLSPACISRFAAAIAEANLRCHLATMGRLGIAYDVLPHESDILHRGFWERARTMLERAGAIRLEREGKNAGCWVMSLADSPEFAGMADADKILVRSNGTVTYTGKDIAYQLWKLGLLRDDDGTVHDFGYREFARFSQAAAAAPLAYGGGDRTLYRTASDPAERPGGVSFGAGERVYNVIDVRQSYPQKVVKEAIRVLGHAQAADNSIHFAYEMVALTPAAVRRLEQAEGVDFALTPEDMAKPFIEMSGRRGIGVKADTLLDTLVDEAESAIVTRQGEDAPLPADELASRAHAIAVGALRYQMARQGRARVLAFDFDEALAFEGDTGPYLQYSAVRANKIFDKLAAQALAGSPEGDAAAAAAAEVADDLWDLVLGCARTAEMASKAVNALEFSLLAGYARDLAQAFHKLYHEHPVLHAPDEPTRALRRAVFRLFKDTIAQILEELLGIPIPAEM
jgi:arginyl-tRNA synthetase